MAEEIKLAGFSLNTDRLEKSLSDLQDAMFKLKKEQEGYNNLSKESQKAINELVKANMQLAASGQASSEAYEENEQAIKDLTAVQQQNYKNAQNVQTQMGRIRTEINTTNKALQAYMDSEGKQTTLLDAGNKALQRQVNTKAEAKAANIELRRIGDQLNVNIAEEAELLAKLNKSIDDNTKFVKANASATDQQAMNVGNYKNDIIAAYKEIDEEKKRLEELNKELVISRDQTKKNSEEWKIFNQQINNNNQQINILITDLKDARGEMSSFNDVLELGNGGISGFLEASTKAGGAGQLIGNSFKTASSGIASMTKAALAFLATPIGLVLGVIAAAIGLVVGAFKLMVSSMNSTEEGANKLAKVTAVVSGVFNGLWKLLKPIGEYIGGAFIKAFEFATAAVDKAVTLISKGLKALGFKETAAAIDTFANSVRQGVKDAVALAEAEQQLAKANREAQRTQLEYQKTAEKLRQIRDDDSKSIKERIAANEQLGKVLQMQMQEELKIANLALKVANLRIKAEGESTEALNERAEALTRISDIQERIVGQESEQLTNRNSLLKEAAELERARREQAVADMEAELARYIASQGIRKKSMEEQLAFEKKMRDDSIKIAEYEYSNKLIKKAEFDTKMLEAQNNYAAAMQQLVIANAEQEFEIWQNANQRRLQDADLLNDQLYQNELQRLNDLSEQQASVETARYVQGEINLKEYQERLKVIDQEYYDSVQATNLEREELGKARDAANLALRMEENQANFDYSLELQNAQEDARYQAQLEWAKKTGADIEAVERIHAANRKKIEETVSQNKMQLASDAFGALAAIAGEESAAGKAFAVTQAIIDTYSSATSSYNSLSGIPIVGPVLGGIAAAAAVAAGMANVKKIKGTKTPTMRSETPPGFATGTIGLNGLGSSVSDSIDARLSAGESVITARATSMFPNTLSAINQAGGGVGLDGQLSSAIMQSQITERADEAMSAELIANAVMEGSRQGTMTGSKQGLVDMSNNREIQNNARF